jgi:hypothetical protein
MKTLKLTSAESAAYAAGERRFWRAIKPQPDDVVCGFPYWHVGGYRLWHSATNPLRPPYGTRGDRIQLTAPRHSLPPVIDTITAITVTQRDGKWGWEIQL